MTPPFVLLVNDIPDHRKLYEAALRQEGFRVDLVHTAAAALVRARSEAPDCAVIDVRLPDMDGWDLCRAFKQDAALRQVPIVILTAEVSEAAAGSGAASGCSAWLAHPTYAHDVPRIVRHVLAQRRSSPASEKDATVGLTQCRGCGSQNIRATLRLGAIQYFACQACRLSWRVENAESVA